MEKRFQVFVSSTYEDLQEERQEVMHALLELDCIPSGMELFPAADDDQWTVIKRVIDDCDYYIVIIGGRYGSLGPDGLSYTEMEYRYAVKSDKPCLAFIHADPGAILAKNTEKTEPGKQKLSDFRDLVKQRMCKTWKTSADLGSVVSRSLIRIMKDTPAIGWVRGDAVPDERAMDEIIRLRHRVEELETEIEETASRAPEGSDELAQGSDLFGVAYGERFGLSRGVEGVVQISWDDLFARVAPLMIDEASDQRLDNAIAQMIDEAIADSPKRLGLMPKSFGEIIVQFRALGLIVKSEKKRSLKDTRTYWKLTSYGDAVMTRLLAIRK